MIRRRPRRGEPENHDRWLVSYADFITLLFAFFVVLYAVSSVNESKVRLFSTSLVTAFGSTPDTQQDVIHPNNEQERLLKSLVERRDARQIALLREQRKRMKLMADDLRRALAPLASRGLVNVSVSQRGVKLDINASVLFDQGEAALQGKAVNILSQVAPILVQGRQSIEVVGYTDNVPIQTPRYPSNWELSSARASSVVRLFIEHGVAAERLTVIGAADNQPVLPNDTAEGRARNRRVTVTILAPSASRIQPAGTPGQEDNSSKEMGLNSGA